MKLFIILLTFGISASVFGQDISNLPYSTSFEGAEGNLNENFPEGRADQNGKLDGFGNQG